MAVIAVVGDGMAGTPGIAARVFSALATGRHQRRRDRAGIVGAQHLVRRRRRRRRRSGALASTRRSSCRKSAAAAPRATPRTDVVLLGFGRVGRALADQIAAAERRAARCASSACSIARATSSIRAGSRGAGCSELAREKDGGALLASLGGRTANGGRSADDDGRATPCRGRSSSTSRARRPATCCAPRSATASTSCWRTRSRSPGRGRATRAARVGRRPAGRRVRYEATVGAGLPIIDTFDKLVETGDRVLRIEGCVSGTLMYIVSAVSARRAVSRMPCGRPSRSGYAEPDPREDLSGRGRGAEGADPGAAARLSRRRAVAGDLVPRPLRSAVARAVHRKRLPAFDAEWAARVGA